MSYNTLVMSLLRRFVINRGGINSLSYITEVMFLPRLFVVKRTTSNKQLTFFQIKQLNIPCRQYFIWPHLFQLLVIHRFFEEASRVVKSTLLSIILAPLGVVEYIFFLFAFVVANLLMVDIISKSIFSLVLTILNYSFALMGRKCSNYGDNSESVGYQDFILYLH